MSEALNQPKERAMLSTKCTFEINDHASAHYRQVTELKSSESKSRSDNGNIVVQFIHFNQNKEGCLE
jgi:hypothetical protein